MWTLLRCYQHGCDVAHLAHAGTCQLTSKHAPTWTDRDNNFDEFQSFSCSSQCPWAAGTRCRLPVSATRCRTGGVRSRQHVAVNLAGPGLRLASAPK